MRRDLDAALLNATTDATGQSAELRRRMTEQVDVVLEQVMASVNAARHGHWIDDSAVAANDHLNDLKRAIYKTPMP